MGHHSAAGAIVIMLRTSKCTGITEGTQTDRTGLSRLRGRVADPVATSEGERPPTGGTVDRLPAQSGPFPELPRSRLALTSPWCCEVNEALVEQACHRCEFLEDAHNVPFWSRRSRHRQDPSRNTAISVQAIERRRQARPEVLDGRSRQRPRTGKATGKARGGRPRLTFATSSSSTSFTPCRSVASGGALLFHLLSKLYEREQHHHHHEPELQRIRRPSSAIRK